VVHYTDWDMQTGDVPEKWDRGELIADPDWQRGYAWKPNDEKLSTLL